MKLGDRGVSVVSSVCGGVVATSLRMSMASGESRCCIIHSIVIVIVLYTR